MIDVACVAVAVTFSMMTAWRAYRWGFDAGCRDERAYWLPALQKAYDETAAVARRTSPLAGDPTKEEAKT